MWYAIVADLVVAVHVAYVSFVVLGQLAIFVGMVLGWSWIRNFWFRVAHLLAMTIVGAEAVWNIECPLTAWESRLRELAGQEAGAGSFVGRLLHGLIFYEFDTWTLNCLHIGFALLVMATFVFAPPRWRSPQTPMKAAGPGSPPSHESSNLTTLTGRQ